MVDSEDKLEDLSESLFDESFSNTKKLKLAEDPNKKDNQSKVTSHYDNLKIQSLSERRKSALFVLRKFNNWVKRTLIRRFCVYLVQYGDKEGKIAVLDICGGKFGDLPKWCQLSEEGVVEYVAIADISRNEIAEAVRRYNKTMEDKEKREKNGADKMPIADFFVADCFKSDLKKIFRKEIPFDLASVQFSLHYAFESEELAESAIKNISNCLRIGGYFIGTIPDANILIKTAREKGKYGPEKIHFGSETHSIAFKGRTDLKFPESNPFGIKYDFFLKDAVHNVQEYLVHPDILMSLCRKNGMKCVLFQNFHEFFQENMKLKLTDSLEAQRSFEKIFSGLEGGTFPALDWDIINLYTVFAFKKVEGEEIRRKRNFGSESVKFKMQSDINIFE